MKTLKEINKEYWESQGRAELPMTRSNVDDVLLFAVKNGDKELIVTSEDMMLIILWATANFSNSNELRPRFGNGDWKGMEDRLEDYINWDKILVEGWMDKLFGINFYRDANSKINPSSE